ncbi:hypothetical protein [Janthinobacterium sp. 1_2014MBL_MicDiv]|uniref:hypothetical protein n=1 Tax=Janthinobacterium sp. 1_2014MBL_MicDiv TaxID=1644131 RepID=UPI000AAF9E59|nr:hypothetical protein [Janthinobacterium sp. 1_2014MBL_MicDiv]
MRPHDDSPRASARPSLLTPAQQAEADRNRILTTLQGGKGGAVAGGATGGRLAVRYGAGAAAALLLLAAGVWLGQRGADAQAPVVAALPAAAATVPDAPPAVARIHDEVPAAIDPAPRQSLNDMLTAAPARSAATPAGDVLSKALETPSAPAARPAKTPARSVPKASHPPAKKPAAKAETAPAASREEESDIALLAALVAHAQVAPVPAPPVASLQSQLQQCAKLKRTAADACRERVCKGRGAGNAQCKAARSAARAGA